jgi:creatinine amidohydrolase
MRKVRWEEMFRDELEAAIAERPVCYLAYGLAEPHGVQNALGLDGLKAQAIVERAAVEHGGVVAPMTWWHVHETPLGTHWLASQNAPVTYLTDVPAEIFLHQLVYQLRAAEIAGFRAAVLVTGHYGGIEVDMKMVAQAYMARRPLRLAARRGSRADPLQGLPRRPRGPVRDLAALGSAAGTGGHLTNPFRALRRRDVRQSL